MPTVLVDRVKHFVDLFIAPSIQVKKSLVYYRPLTVRQYIFISLEGERFLGITSPMV